MSSSAESAAKAASMKPTKVCIPKVWKRPHSTIYGKNVEFGSKLTSDKLGEINGRKFNSELPWQMRNSGGSSGLSSSSGSHQGYLSRLLNEPESTLIGSVVRAKPSGSGYFNDGAGGSGRDSMAAATAASSTSGGGGGLMSGERASQLSAASCLDYADVLEVTNPNRYSKRRREQLREAEARRQLRPGYEAKNRRIDFFENYLNFSNEISRLSESSRLANDPLLQQRAFDKNLDFNHELGLFVPSSSAATTSASGDGRHGHVFCHEPSGLARKRTLQRYEQQLEAGHVAAALPSLPSRHARYQDTPAAATNPSHPLHDHHLNQLQHRDEMSDINNCNYLFNPVVTTTQQTHLLPKHDCQLSSSPYGQSADGRKLSLGSINPHSYRPSLPHKTSTVHASDGEEFEFQDKSSPFYTDRWAGKTIRHFDSDLYSNANLFKSMIL